MRLQDLVTHLEEQNATLQTHTEHLQAIIFALLARLRMDWRSSSQEQGPTTMPNTTLQANVSYQSTTLPVISDALQCPDTFAVPPNTAPVAGQPGWTASLPQTMSAPLLPTDPVWSLP